MLSVKEKGLLLSILKHCERIKEKTDVFTFAQFRHDEDLIQIICFNLLQIGELAKKFEPSFVKRFSVVPWKQIKGMRDKVAHGYDTIDIDKVWETAVYDIKDLIAYCVMILRDVDS